jgi:hypothetical protein
MTSPGKNDVEMTSTDEGPSIKRSDEHLSNAD